MGLCDWTTGWQSLNETSCWWRRRWTQTGLGMDGLRGGDDDPLEQQQ